MVQECFLKPSFFFKYTSKCCRVPSLIPIASAPPLFNSNIDSSDDNTLIQVFLPLLFQVSVPKLVPHLPSNFNSRYSFDIPQFFSWIIMNGLFSLIVFSAPSKTLRSNPSTSIFKINNLLLIFLFLKGL